jgi:hypothetical protein
MQRVIFHYAAGNTLELWEAGSRLQMRESGLAEKSSRDPL